MIFRREHRTGKPMTEAIAFVLNNKLNTTTNYIRWNDSWHFVRSPEHICGVSLIHSLSVVRCMRSCVWTTGECIFWVILTFSLREWLSLWWVVSLWWVHFCLRSYWMKFKQKIRNIHLEETRFFSNGPKLFYLLMAISSLALHKTHQNQLRLT